MPESVAAFGRNRWQGLNRIIQHVENLVIVPQFNQKKEDLRALETFREMFGSNYSVVPFDSRRIAEGGGVLNCASWIVKE